MVTHMRKHVGFTIDMKFLSDDAKEIILLWPYKAIASEAAGGSPGRPTFHANFFI